MKKPLLLVMALGISAFPAFAQGDSPYLGANITRTYTLADIATRPGLLQLGKADMLVLDFPDDVSAVVTPQAAMMDLPEPLGNVVVMTGKVSSGKAQLLIQLENGKSVFFMVQFTPGGNGMKRIKVVDEPKLSYAQPVASAPAAKSSMPSYTAPQSAAPIPITTQAAAVATSGTQAQLQSALEQLTAIKGAAIAPLTRLQPDWLRLSAKLQNDTNGDALDLIVTNNGLRPLVLNGKDLIVTQDGHQVEATTEDIVTVGPGEAKRVNVKFTTRTAGGSALRLDWLAFDAGSNAFYRVTARGL